MDNEEIITKAGKWVAYYKGNQRGKMDTVLEGLTAGDRRKVVLCGQRIAGGLTAKVTDDYERPVRKEAKKGKENTNHEEAETKRRRPSPTGKSVTNTETEVSVGTDSSTKKGRSRGKGANGKK